MKWEIWNRDAGQGHGTKVVMKLKANKLNQGLALYIDTFYNSYYLAQLLLKNKTYCTETLRTKLIENLK